VDDPAQLRQLQRQALGVHIKALAAALLATAAVYLLA